MPCRYALRFSAAAEEPKDLKVAQDHDDDGNKRKRLIESWESVRRHNLRWLRKEIRSVVIFMVLTEAVKTSAVPWSYYSKEGYASLGEDSYGIAFNIAYFFSWLYTCASTVILFPLVSLWAPVMDEPSGETDATNFLKRLLDFLQQLNLALFPVLIGVTLVFYVYYLVQTLIYVDAKVIDSTTLRPQWPANNKKNWLMRLLLLTTILTSLSCGYYAFDLLDTVGLAHVKPMEYLVIVVPVQINLGIILGSIVQMRIERKIERRRLAFGIDKAVEEGRADGKEALLVE